MRKKPSGTSSMIFPIFLCGVLAGAIIIIASVIQLEITSYLPRDITMEYGEFLSITLTSLSVIITALAIGIGVLALWGYSQFVKITQTSAEAHVEKLLLEGSYNSQINEIIVSSVMKELDGGTLEDIVKKNVERILYNDAETRAEAKPENQDSEFSG